MTKLDGKFIVSSSKLPVQKLRYERLSDPLNFNLETDALLLNSLASKFDVLVGNIKLIVSRYGSPLSHLAIVAREHKVPVFVTSDDISILPDTGQLKVNDESIEVV